MCVPFISVCLTMDFLLVKKKQWPSTLAILLRHLRDEYFDFLRPFYTKVSKLRQFIQVFVSDLSLKISLKNFGYFSKCQLVKIFFFWVCFSCDFRHANTSFMSFCFDLILKHDEFTTVITLGIKEWRSGESARLPPMRPGFKFRRRRHIWVEFVVGSLLCSERFFSGHYGLPLSSKTNISKFQFD